LVRSDKDEEESELLEMVSGSKVDSIDLGMSSGAVRCVRSGVVAGWMVLIADACRFGFSSTLGEGPKDTISLSLF
jgi:hypothetical protein